MKKIVSTIVSAILLVASTAFALPTVHDIWEATQRGDYHSADRMIGQVLKSEPNSAKAHYVYANVLEQEGNLSQAKHELERAESLDPSDSFANTSSIQKLKAELNPPMYTNTNHSALFIFGVLLLVVALIIILITVFKWLFSESPAAYTHVVNSVPPTSTPNSGRTNYNPIPPYSNTTGSGTTIINNNPSSSSGAGKFVEGAVVGAVAGALVEHALDDNKSSEHTQESDRDFGTTNNPEPEPTTDNSSSSSSSDNTDWGTSTTDSKDNNFGTSNSSSSDDFGTDNSSSSDDFGSSNSDSSDDFGSGGNDNNNW